LQRNKTHTPTIHGSDTIDYPGVSTAVI